jgi:tripartite-type tricarboxylate transporter receptor subunit TctC
MPKSIRYILTVTLAICSAHATAQSTGYPAKAITIAHPQATGGPIDITMRLVAQKASEYLGQTIVVEPRPGAGGTVSAAYVKQAQPDGYTLLLGSHESLAINVALMPKLPYDPIKDFAPVTLLWNNPTLLTVSSSSPARTLGDLVAMAKRAPDAVSYATAGIGTTGHLAGHMLATSAGTTMVHVPYKGSVDALNDLMSGRVDMYLGSYASVAAFHKAGKIRLLAAVSQKRTAIAPDVPTMPELGYPEIHFDTWFGILAPSRTAQPVVQRLHDDFVKAVTNPDVQSKLTNQGTVILTSATPSEFGTFIASEIVRLGRAAKLSGATPD